MSEETASALPYLNLLAGKDPLPILAEAPGHLAALFEGLSPEQIEQKPSPEKWNLREITAHIADCEIAWSWRYRLIYGEHNPELQSFEQDSWGRAYPSYSLAQAQATWAALRAWNVALLGGLTEEERNRPARHPSLGGVTLWTVASIAAGHDIHHFHSLDRVVRGMKG